MGFVTLKRVDPMSYARIEAILGAIGGFIAFLVIWAIVGVLASLSPVVSVLGGIGVWLPVVGLVLGAIGGFIVGYIAAVVYNFIASKIGGIQINLSVTNKMSTLDHIGIQSYAKMLAVFLVIGGLIFGIIIALVGSAISSAFGLFGEIAIIALPILGLILGLVFGIIYSAIYNLVAGKVGGVRFALKGSNGGELTMIDAMQYAKVIALLEVVLGFIGALFTLVGVNHGTSGLVSLIVVPIIDGVFGFIFGYIFVVIYNFVAKKIGGVKVVFGK